MIPEEILDLNPSDTIPTPPPSCEPDRFLAGAMLVCCGALLAAGGQNDGPLGAGAVAVRGCELMGIPAPGGTSALAYVSAAARAIMVRWPA